VPPRTADPANRLQLLDDALDYVAQNGVASMSLRRLGDALGVSAGLLLYHFESKERLIVELLTRAGDRQRALFDNLRSEDTDTPEDVCRNVWRVLSEADAQPLFRLFFEVYGLALADPGRFPGFFPAAVSNWLTFLEAPALRAGATPADARRRATILLAGFRGFLLDLCATRDHARVDDAVNAWILSLNAC
jgi:AcrR family transcriptional regulator